jgi:hypothetical protein
MHLLLGARFAPACTATTDTRATTACCTNWHTTTTEHTVRVYVSLDASLSSTEHGFTTECTVDNHHSTTQRCDCNDAQNVSTHTTFHVTCAHTCASRVYTASSCASMCVFAKQCHFPMRTRAPRRHYHHRGSHYACVVDSLSVFVTNRSSGSCCSANTHTQLPKCV